MINEFYVMRPWGNHFCGKRYAYAQEVRPFSTGSSSLHGTCPVCGVGLGILPWLPPHRLKLSKQAYPDLLWGAGAGPMVSERFLDGYRASGMAGITHVDPPAEVVKVGGRPVASVFPPPPVYHNIRYVHGGAAVDDAKSEAIRYRTTCTHCRQNVDGVQRVVFEEGSWTGVDIFEPFGLPGHVVVTARFKALCDDWEMTGSLFIPADSYVLTPKMRPPSTEARTA